MSRVGVITNDPDGIFQRGVIAGMREVMQRYQYEVQIAEVTPRPQTLAEIDLNFARLKGVLVIANILPDDLLSQILELNTPVSLISHQTPLLPIPSVLPNNRQGIEVLMHHLIVTCGRTRPLFIQGDSAQSDGLLRELAFRTELLRYNLSLPDSYLLRGDFEPRIAAEAVAQFLQTGQPFDSVLAADFQMGVAALDVLRLHGKRVPQDIVVVGFGDGPEAAVAGMTTVAADVIELGRRGARQLLGQINGLRIRGLTLLSTDLVIRNTG